MLKLLVLALLAVYASAAINFLGRRPLSASTNPNFTLQFIQGFNHQLKIDTDVNFNNCTNIPLIQDLNKTIHDLNKNNVSYVVIAEDAYKLYRDSDKMKKFCPQAEATYKTYFANFSLALKKDPRGTWSNVWQNVNGHWNDVEDLISQLSGDFQQENGYQAGEDFGKIVAIALQGYINDTGSVPAPAKPSTFSTNPNFTLDFVQGFNHQLDIDEDVNFNNCTSIPLLQDIYKTIHDFNQTNVNYLDLLKDLLRLYDDNNRIKQYCPEAEATYKNFFSNFTVSAKNDPRGTLVNVYHSVNTNRDQVEDLAQQMTADFQQENGYQAGEDFGKVISIVLQGYI